MRRALGKVAAQLSKRVSVATTIAQAGGRSPADAAQAVVEGLILGAYRFDRYKSKKEDARVLETVTVLGTPRWDAKAVKAALARAQVVSEAAAWARDLVNTPARDMTPAVLARRGVHEVPAPGRNGHRLTTWARRDPRLHDS